MKPAAEAWLPMVCPACDTEFRIKEAYGHLRGRCPNCGDRIQPPRPLPIARLIHPTGGDPLDLVPLEDEWPEPAVIESADVGVAYGMAAAPVISREQKPDVPGDEDIFTLAMNEAAAPAKTPAEPARQTPAKSKAPKKPPEDAPYDLFFTGDISLAARQSKQDAVAKITRYQPDYLKPGPEHQPPRWPLILGIYTFPFRLQNLGRWLLLALGITVLGFQVHYMVYLLMTGAQIAIVAVGFIALGAIWVFIFTGTYGAAYFLQALQDTADGNDEVAWPDEGWKMLFFELFFMGWILACTVIIPAGILVAYGVRPALTGLIVLTLFPIGLVSTLGNGSIWYLIDVRVIYRLLVKPWALAMLYVHSAIIGAAVYGVNLLVLNYFLAMPLAGLVWSACLLIHGRMLGRVIWVLENSGTSGTRRVRKRRKAGAESTPKNNG